MASSLCEETLEEVPSIQTSVPGGGTVVMLCVRVCVCVCVVCVCVCVRVCVHACVCVYVQSPE